MSRDKQIDELADLANEIWLGEIECWERIGTSMPKTTRLVRSDPIVDFNGPGPATYGIADIPDDQVNAFLRRTAMKKAIEAVLQRAPVS